MRILTCLAVFFSLTVFAADSKEIAKVGVVFVDEGTFELALVRYGDPSENTYLAEISGVDDPLNGKVLKVRATGGGTSATYYEREGGGNLLRAPQHQYFGWEAYLGNKTFKINQDTKKTKALKTETVLAKYLKGKK